MAQINYRGSSGYGQKFMEAAIGEFGRKMHDDLLDGLQSLVNQGITDPQHVAIMGRSFGGYEALVGLTFTPETFACGVDIVGVSDLTTQFGFRLLRARCLGVLGGGPRSIVNSFPYGRSHLHGTSFPTIGKWTARQYFPGRKRAAFTGASSE